MFDFERLGASILTRPGPCSSAVLPALNTALPLTKIRISPSATSTGSGRVITSGDQSRPLVRRAGVELLRGHCLRQTGLGVGHEGWVRLDTKLFGLVDLYVIASASEHAK